MPLDLGLPYLGLTLLPTLKLIGRYTTRRSESQGTETNSHAFVGEPTGVLLRLDHTRTFVSLSEVTRLTHNLEILKMVPTALGPRRDVVLSHKNEAIASYRVEAQMRALSPV